MNKYEIEGGINFFAQLYKSLDSEDSEEKTENDKDNCLITNEPLIDKYVTLKCGHKFNYIPIYNDLVNYKRKFNNMESLSRRLNTNEIRCPYCREKQKGLLPYYKDLGLKKVNGVNFYNPYNEKNAHHICEYIYPNINYDPSKPESIINTPYLNNTKCHIIGFQIAVFNPENPAEPINYGDTKHYCYTHKEIMIKIYKNEHKEKVKLAKKQAKELEKQMKKEEKLKAKAKEKEEKLKAKAKEKDEKLKAKAKEKDEKLKAKATTKAFNNNLITENIVLGPLNIENKPGCVQILKTGPNKGHPCGCKIFLDNRCKRHIPKN
jgi:hypothetical protein